MAKWWALVLGGLLLAEPGVAVAAAPMAAAQSSAPGAADAAREHLPYLLAERTANYNHATPSQAGNIELCAKRLNGVLIQPGQVFSYYGRVGPYDNAHGYGWGRAFVGDRIVPSVGGGVCQCASVLYSTLLRTGLSIVERHQHGLTVPYLPPGEDATVSGDYLNFRFKNNRSTPVMLATRAGNRLITIAVWGAEPAPKITVRHKTLETVPFRTIVRVNPKLAPGESKVLAPGQDGVSVHTWLEIQQPDGKTVTQDLGIDRYRPSPRIIEKGPAS